MDANQTMTVAILAVFATICVQSFTASWAKRAEHRAAEAAALARKAEAELKLAELGSRP